MGQPQNQGYRKLWFLKGSCQKDGKAYIYNGCGRLMIQKGKAYLIGYLSMHESLEITASAFSRPIKSFCIRKIIYKEKTISTSVLWFKTDGNKFLKLTFIVIYLWHASDT